MMQLTPEEIRELFRARDLRCTHQRELVYAGLAATRAHPTAEELYHGLRATDPHISMATVYNTLEALESVGLVRRLGMGSGPSRFDADTSTHVHVRTPDGRVVDAPPDISRRLLEAIPAEALRDLESRMSLRLGVLSVQVVAEGGVEKVDVSMPSE